MSLKACLVTLCTITSRKGISSSKISSVDGLGYCRSRRKEYNPSQFQRKTKYAWINHSYSLILQKTDIEEVLQGYQDNNEKFPSLSLHSFLKVYRYKFNFSPSLYNIVLQRTFITRFLSHLQETPAVQIKLMRFFTNPTR